MNAENKVPAIRFKGFSRGWDKNSFSNISESFEYGLNAAATKYDGKNKYIRITDINEDTRTFDLGDITSPNADLSKADNYRLQLGDILFARTGASVGKTYIYRKQDGLVYFAGFLIRARVKKEVNTEFVFQSTLTEKYNKFIRLTSQRSGQPGVNALEYGSYKIFLASSKEQTKIGNYFQQLDTLIAQHQKKHDKLLNLKKALLEKMFPKQGATVPEIRFKGFSEEWEGKVLGDIGCFKSGGGFPEIEQNGQAGTPYFKVSDMNIDGNQMVMIFANNYVNEEQIARLNYKPIGEKSIIFAKVGAAIFLERKRIAKKFLIDNNMMAFSPTENVGFIKLWFDSIELSKYVQVGALPSYNASDLKVIELCIPLKEEQTKIGNLFKQLDTLLNQHQTQLKKLNNIKQACLEKMFA